MKLKCRKVNQGRVEGEAIVSRVPFSFLGELDPSTGKITAPSHDLFGKIIKDKIFVCPSGKGSSSGPTIAYTAKKAGTLPKAMIVSQIEPAHTPCAPSARAALMMTHAAVKDASATNPNSAGPAAAPT